MSLSTNMISGLASGIDWRTMVDQLMAIEHRRVDLVENQKSDYESQLSEWQSLNTTLLSLKTSAEALKDPEDFYLYTSTMSSDSVTYDAEDLLSVSTSTDAAVGTYTVTVTNLAQAQKLSSNPFSSQTDDLGSSYAGDFIINGEVITVNSTDSLADLADTINNANTGTDPTGVTAGIVNYGTNDYRLILTSDDTGVDGISLLNGSSTNLVQKFGWKDNGTETIKNSITQGAQSDRFTNQSTSIYSLLGLNSDRTSTTSLTIDSEAVVIDLKASGGDSLSDIATAINAVMVGVGKDSSIVASVVSETEDNTTYYRLQIEGTQLIEDEDNILNTLGILDHNSSSVSGEVSGNSMTEDGAYISADTLLVDIDGYISHTGGDKITLTGSDVSGVAITASDLSITSSTTVQDLLDKIETLYSVDSGDVVAYVTSEGKIRVDDVAGGGGLSVTLADSITNGQLEFVDSDAEFSDGSARLRQIVAGEDATVEIDGVEVTDSSNKITDVISGVTLNLVAEDDATTVTLNIDHDISDIKTKINDFVDNYNAVMTYINGQFNYDEEEETTGGVLFGDATLRSVKSNLTSDLTESIWGVDSDFSILALVGITVDNDLLLEIDDSDLTGYLETNFNDVMALFVGQGTTSTSTLSYIGHDIESEAGEYTVHINRAATQATETGSVVLSGGGADEILTITQGTATAEITITNTMTLNDIINEINQELDTEYTETLVGDLQLQSGGSAITAETKWNVITGTTLANDDEISFSGTDRSGSSVSGSYTISNVATDTVQGLLSAIDDAFSSKVSASIDTFGRIVITDKYTGSSALTIDITEPVGKGLNFGTIDVTDGAGDGSQEGRYAMPITATDDGSGHLVLENDDYGSSSFTISQDTGAADYNHIIYTDTSNTTVSTSGAVYVTESTTWDDIYGADVVNDDTITISGTDRAGNPLSTATVSLTYTASDISTDTVGDLLTQIENAFADDIDNPTNVNAFIRDGKIYVEDQTAGASSVSLTLTANKQGGGSLDLGGDIDQTTERESDLGLINGIVTGLDVAGTINGETATGSGQVLSGDDDNANTDGLSVMYTGSSDDVDAGTITLTLGVAELFYRSLYYITDSVDGYAAFKQDSLQDSIDDYEDRIEDMEALLDLKMERMINKFVSMELALSKIQSQSAWLSGQVSSAAGAWKL